MINNPEAGIRTDWGIAGIVKPAHLNALAESIQYDYVLTAKMIAAGMDANTHEVNVDMALGGDKIRGIPDGIIHVLINTTISPDTILYFPDDNVGAAEGNLQIHVHSIGPFPAIIGRNGSPYFHFYFHSHGPAEAVTIKGMAAKDVRIGAFNIDPGISIANDQSFIYETALGELPTATGTGTVTQAAWMSNSAGTGVFVGTYTGSAATNTPYAAYKAAWDARKAVFLTYRISGGDVVLSLEDMDERRAIFTRTVGTVQDGTYGHVVHSMVRIDASNNTYTFYNADLGGGSGQIQSDWAQADDSAVDYIRNKPDLAAVATSGSYADLDDAPNIFIGRYGETTRADIEQAIEDNKAVVITVNRYTVCSLLRITDGKYEFASPPNSDGSIRIVTLDAGTGAWGGSYTDVVSFGTYSKRFVDVAKTITQQDITNGYIDIPLTFDAEFRIAVGRTAMLIGLPSNQAFSTGTGGNISSGYTKVELVLAGESNPPTVAIFGDLTKDDYGNALDSGNRQYTWTRTVIGFGESAYTATGFTARCYFNTHGSIVWSAGYEAPLSLYVKFLR